MIRYRYRKLIWDLSCAISVACITVYNPISKCDVCRNMDETSFDDQGRRSYEKELGYGKEITEEEIDELDKALEGIPRRMIAMIMLTQQHDLAEAYNKLWVAENEDKKTGLGTGEALKKALEFNISQLVNNGVPSTAMFIDLTKFKDINDELGHLEGDRALQLAADIMRKTFRSRDFIARYGGDEFVAVLPNTDIEVVKIIIDRLQENLQKEKELNPNDKTLQMLGFDIGSDSIKKEDTVGVIIEKIDKLMYERKRGETNEE